MPGAMATQHRGGARPPPGSSSNQASRTKSSVSICAARCRVFRGQKLKDEKSANGLSHSKNTPGRDSVAFGYSAGSSAASYSTSNTNTLRQTAQAARVYGRNAASCLHFLKRKIKLTMSRIDSVNHDLESGIGLLNSKLSSYAQNLENKIQQLNDTKGSHADVVIEFERLKNEQDLYAHNLVKKIKLLKKSHDNVVGNIEYVKFTKDDFDKSSADMIRSWKANKRLEAHELDRQIKNQTFSDNDFHQCTVKEIQRLTALKNAYANQFNKLVKLQKAKALSNADELDKQIKLLSARKDTSARDLVRQVQILNAKTVSYARDLKVRVDLFNQQITSYQHEIRRQSELVDSRKAPFVQDLDSQLKLLESKLVTFYHDLKTKLDLLNSNLNSYFEDVDRKVGLLTSGMASYLGRDIPLLN